MEHHAVSEKLLGFKAFEITDLTVRKPQGLSPFPIEDEEFVARTAVVRFYLRRTCILFSLQCTSFPSHVHFICVARAFSVASHVLPGSTLAVLK